jgi:tRNA nucleotidyltransferase (CCA-adding enzyme)
MITLPLDLEPIIRTLIDHDITPVLVGGYLRDLLMDASHSKDIDIELYGLESIDSLIDLLKPFGTAHDVGRSFGVIKLHYKGFDLDFSLPRIERKSAIGHRGFDVTTYQSLPFSEAALRRDFTINAMGYDLKSNTLLDPYSGLDDIKAKRLHCVNAKSFIEDPLRLLRAMQFSARFKFECSQELIALCNEMYQQNALSELPKERIFEELKKLLLRADTPSLGFRVLERMDALSFFKPLYALHVKENDRYENMLFALDNLANSDKPELSLMLVRLTSDITDGSIQKDFLHFLSDEKKLIDDVLTLSHYYSHIERYKDISDYELKKLALHVKIASLCSLALAGKEVSIQNIGAKLLKRAKTLGVSEYALKPLLQGRHLIALGLKPSKTFKTLLDEAYDAQLNDSFSTIDEATAWIKKRLMAHL